MNAKTNSRKWSWKQLKERQGARMALLLLTLAMTVTHLTAQVFTTLHSFTGSSDGATPQAGLILSGSTLYGAADSGGGSGYGTLFNVRTDGMGFKVLETFNGVNNEAYPESPLLLSGDTLYGASLGPGTTWGALFAVNTNGTSFTTLHTFSTISAPDYTNSDGGGVWGRLILSGNTLYGMTQVGGSGASGTVFAVNTNGTVFTTLHSFTAASPSWNPYGTLSPPYINSDGAYPAAGLILSGSTLYGMTVAGGSSGWGTVFAVNTDGTDFTTLYRFTGGSDGGWPRRGPLVLSGNTLYGTTYQGGGSGNGTVFAVNTNGTGFTVLHSFTGSSDGANPIAGLILSGNTLYGMANVGGSWGMGTVFAVNNDGTGFTNLHDFDGSSDGANPYAGLILSRNTLYGTAYNGGTYGYGTVFSLSFPSPQLKIVRSGTNVNLTWPSAVAGFSYSGYSLQSTTNLGPSAIWTTNSSVQVVLNGQNTVTNPISGTQQFFRLSR